MQVYLNEFIFYSSLENEWNLNILQFFSTEYITNTNENEQWSLHMYLYSKTC